VAVIPSAIFLLLLVVSVRRFRIPCRTAPRLGAAAA
jgi:hypothetical protein